MFKEPNFINSTTEDSNNNSQDKQNDRNDMDKLNKKALDNIKESHKQSRKRIVDDLKNKGFTQEEINDQISIIDKMHQNSLDRYTDIPTTASLGSKNPFQNPFQNPFKNPFQNPFQNPFGARPIGPKTKKQEPNNASNTKKNEEEIINSSNLENKEISELLNKIGINYDELDPNEKNSFEYFYKTSDKQSKKDLILFIEKFGKNGFKTFLSLENNNSSGKEILKTSKELSRQPKLQHKLFEEYSKILKDIDSFTQELQEMYKEVYANEDFNINNAKHSISENCISLMQNLSSKLVDLSGKEKTTIVGNLIKDLKRQEKIRIRQLQDLSSINNKYQQSKKDLVKKLKLENTEWEIMCSLFGDPNKYTDPYELKEAIDSGEVTEWWMDPPTYDKESGEMDMYNLNKYFKVVDSKFLDKMINKADEDIEKWEDYIVEMGYVNLKNQKNPDPIDVKNYENYKKMIENSKKTKDRVEKILEFQDQFEELFHKLAYNIKSNRTTEEDEAKTNKSTENEIPNEVNNKINNNLSKTLFTKYQGIIDLAKKNKDDLKKLFQSEKDISDEELDKMANSILKKANATLNYFTNKIINDEEVDEEALEEELDNCKQEQLLFAYVCKALEEVNFEDLKGANFIQTSFEDLDSSVADNNDLNSVNDYDYPTIPANQIKQKGGIVNQIIDLYKNNYNVKPDLQILLIEGILNKIKSKTKNTNLYAYTQLNKEGEEQLISFIRFDKLDKDRRYFGSFNTKSSLAGSAIGHALLKASFKREEEIAKKDGVKKENLLIEGDCEPEKNIASSYIEDYNFIVTKVQPNFADTTTTAFHIEGQESNKKYKYKSHTKEELINEYEKKFKGNEYKNNDNEILLKYSSLNGEPIINMDQISEMLKELEKLVHEKKFIITRYFFSKDRKEIYCGLEKINET